MPSLHTHSIMIPLSLSTSRIHLLPDAAGTPTMGTQGGSHTTPTTPQNSYNHLAILKHHHQNNKHNHNNNTVSTTHTHEKSISSPHSNRSSILCHNFVSTSAGFYFSTIYLSKTYLSLLRITRCCCTKSQNNCFFALKPHHAMVASFFSPQYQYIMQPAPTDIPAFTI